MGKRRWDRAHRRVLSPPLPLPATLAQSPGPTASVKDNLIMSPCRWHLATRKCPHLPEDRLSCSGIDSLTRSLISSPNPPGKAAWEIICQEALKPPLPLLKRVQVGCSLLRRTGGGREAGEFHKGKEGWRSLRGLGSGSRALGTS